MDEQPEHIKKVSVRTLRPGMYVHDVNCPWMDHPFVTNEFMVRNEERIREIIDLQIQEVYIDTLKGLDVPDAPTQSQINRQLSHDIGEILATARRDDQPTPIAQEIVRARKLHTEANKVVRSVMRDVRVGRQIEMEAVTPMVENIVDSIFRNQNALLPLAQLKEHDSYTFEHSVSVSALLASFARGMGMSREEITQVAMGGLLHDVGKARIPDNILNKPAKLTEGEFAKMKSHVVQSIIILQHTEGVSDIAMAVAAQHHERFDGTGYPNKLKDKEISLYGRMGAIVDVYDALTSDRVYHKGMAPTAALGRLLEWSKLHFDPELVRAYIRSIGIYPTGSLVRLKTGRLGVVIEQHPERPMQPQVRVIFHALQKVYLPPEVLDLAKSSCRDEIVGHEGYEEWDIDPVRWLHPPEKKH